MAAACQWVFGEYICSSFKEESGLWIFFDQCVAESTAVRTAGIDAVTEMSQYLKTKNLERKDDPIRWWKDQEAVYPNLQRSA